MTEEEKKAIDNLRIQVMNFNEKEDRILLNYIDKLQKENTEFKKDISNMYDKEVVISIICDNFDVTRLEALEMLGEDE